MFVVDATLFGAVERDSMLDMWCRYECNSFGLYEGGQYSEGEKSIGAAFFLRSSFFNHSWYVCC